LRYDVEDEKRNPKALVLTSPEELEACLVPSSSPVHYLATEEETLESSAANSNSVIQGVLANVVI
jgi:hypothetical protein